MQADGIRLALADAGVTRDQLDAVHSLASYIRPLQMLGMNDTEYRGILPRFPRNFDIGGIAAFIAMTP